METQINKKNVRKAIKSLVGARLCGGHLWNGQNFCAVGHLAAVLGPPPEQWKTDSDRTTAACKVVSRELGCTEGFAEQLVSVNDNESFPKSLSRTERLRRGLQALLSKDGARKYLKTLGRRHHADDVREELESMKLVDAEDGEEE